MSQRTRAHTTGAADKPTSRAERPATEAPAAEALTAEAPAPRRSKRNSAPNNAPSDLPLSSDALARALRAVATELERDSALAHRVAQAMSGEAPTEAAPTTAAHGEEPAKARKAAAEAPTATIGRSFRPTLITGVGDELGPGVPDPFALRKKLGEVGLRDALALLRLGSLRAIVRQHGLDPDGHLSKQNDAAKLRAHILAVTARAGK